MYQPKMTSAVLAVTAATMMAFVATASATLVTAPSGTKYDGVIGASSEGATTLDGVLDVTCQRSTMEGDVEVNGTTHSGKTSPASGSVTSLTFTECGDDTVVVLASGSLRTGGIGSGDGLLVSTGAVITIVADTIFGDIHCIFETNGTYVGTLTAASGNSGHATLHVDHVTIPRIGGSAGGLCGSEAEWTGSYKVNAPTGLRID